MPDFKSRDKVVILRLNRLDYVPSGLYASELLVENAKPVLAIEYGFFERAIEKQSCKVPRLRFGHPWLRRVPHKFRAPMLHASAFLRIFAYFVKQGRPRLLIAEGLNEQALAWGFYQLLGIPYAVHVHEVYESSDARGWNRFFLALEGLALRAARFTIFPQPERANIYRERYRLEAAQHLAFNCPRRRSPSVSTDWRKRLGLGPKSRLLGYWGGQGRTNALEQGIRAVARIPNLCFLLWGWSSAADREYFKKLATGVGAGDRILFLGELPEDKWPAIAGLDASYCLYEPKELRLKYLATASNKLMESLACGVPVITSSEADFKTLVEFYDVGVCSDGFDVGSVASALKDLFEDEIRRKRFSENALRSHREIFHYEYQFKPVLRALEGILAPRATA